MTDPSRKPQQRRLGGSAGHVPPEEPVIFAGIRIQAVKDRAMHHFGLKNESGSEFQKLYFLYDHVGRIEHLNLTLHEYARDRHDLEFKLVEEIVQGFGEPPPSADAALLIEDLSAIRASEDGARWTIEQPTWMEVWAILSPRSAPQEGFQVRLLWSRYPHAAPSMKFRDPMSGRLDLPTAWPIARGFRPTSLDACVNYTAEGFSLHPEWQLDPRLRWEPRGNALWRVLGLIQSSLDESFQGRFRG